MGRTVTTTSVGAVGAPHHSMKKNLEGAFKEELAFMPSQGSSGPVEEEQRR